MDVLETIAARYSVRGYKPDPAAAREVLGLPGEGEPIAFTPLGYPDKAQAKTDRQPLDELVRYERW